MGRMLEAIKQIEAKGPLPVAAGMRPTPRRRPSAPTAGAAVSAPPATPGRVRMPISNEQAIVLASPEPEFIAPAELEPLASAPLLAAAPEPRLQRQPPADHVQRVAAAIVSQIPALSSGTVALVTAERQLDPTSICAALAEALAAGPSHEVLLIDGRIDQQPVRLAEYWGGAPGLQDVLRRQATWHEAIRPSGLPGLSILESGTPGVVAGSEPWRLLWSDLKRRFRFVLLDGGPAASAATWASTVDAVYLLVELERTARWTAEQAVRQLQQFGARLAGSLLLDAQLRG